MPEKKVKITRKQALWIVLAALALLLLAFPAGKLLRAREKNADTREQRLAFIAALGWDCRAETEQTQEVRIPDCGEGAMADYNALMLAAGYDLAPYAGKSVQQYTYEIENYPGYSQTVYLTLYVDDGRVIGGDIHTAALTGFMHELRERPPA